MDTRVAVAAGRRRVVVCEEQFHPQFRIGRQQESSFHAQAAAHPVVVYAESLVRLGEWNLEIRHLWQNALHQRFRSIRCGNQHPVFIEAQFGGRILIGDFDPCDPVDHRLHIGR